MLTEAVAGLTGDAWLERDPGALPWIIDAFAAFLRRLHALPIDECPFEAGLAHRLVAARRLIASGVVDEEDFGEEHRGWSAERVLARVESLALHATTREQVITHGDFSLGNLLLDAEGQVTGCIDVGRLGRADPYQDVAIFWQNLADHGVEAQARFLAATGHNPSNEARLNLYGALDELF